MVARVIHYTMPRCGLFLALYSAHEGLYIRPIHIDDLPAEIERMSPDTYIYGDRVGRDAGNHVMITMSLDSSRVLKTEVTPDQHLVSIQFHKKSEFLDVCSRKWWWKIPYGDEDFALADQADDEDAAVEEFDDAMDEWLVEQGEEDAADYEYTDVHEKRISENGARGDVWCCA